MKKIRVLVVDDSALVRQMLTEGLGKDPRIEVVGAASNPYQARDKILQLNPDVMTLDVEMPRMDGVAFLRKLMPQRPMPVVMVSSLTEAGAQTTLDALAAGAVDFVTKPASGLSQALPRMLRELCSKIVIASVARVKAVAAPKQPPSVIRSHSLTNSTDKVIAIGASTGGTEALRRVLARLPADTPGIVVVQHMPPKFTHTFAQALNDACQMSVKEAESGDRVMNGRVLIAPGGMHMHVRRSGGQYNVFTSDGEKVNGHRPSVDVLFDSVAKYVGSNAVGAILTGMGGDGAAGMLRMRQAGARTVAQNEESCVVFGMPKVAIEMGAAEVVDPLDRIAERLIEYIRAPARASSRP